MAHLKTPAKPPTALEEEMKAYWDTFPVDNKPMASYLAKHFAISTSVVERLFFPNSYQNRLANSRNNKRTTPGRILSVSKKIQRRKRLLSIRQYPPLTPEKLDQLRKELKEFESEFIELKKQKKKGIIYPNVSGDIKTKYEIYTCRNCKKSSSHEV